MHTGRLHAMCPCSHVPVVILLSLSRLGMLSGGNTAAGRWLRAGTQTTAKMQAKKLREAARLKAL